MTLFAENLARIQKRIETAAARTGRRANEITLVAVTKKQPAERVAEALAAGIKNIGENYVQEGEEKRNLLAEPGAAFWHLIGHLQSNKARIAVQLFDMIQSVDSVTLAQALGRHALAIEKTQQILLQVHLGEETTKSGIAPEQALDMAARIADIEGIALCGLMGIAPGGVEPRPYFQTMRRLFEGLPLPQRQTLSMGMTGDFDAAIDEGATMIRIGTALFGPRID